MHQALCGHPLVDWCVRDTEGLSLESHLLHQDLSQAAIVDIGTALHLHQELLQQALWVTAEGRGVLAGSQASAWGSNWLLADAKQALCLNVKVPRLRGQTHVC